MAVQGQYTFDYDRQPYTWLTDARAEAMGRANMALAGDLRSLATNPAGLAEMNGVQAYFRHATPYYLFEQSTFMHAAIGCRLTDRLAFGFRYDQNELKSDRLTFGDPITGPVESKDPRGVFGAAVAYRVAKDFSIGVAIANVNLVDKNVAQPHLDCSLSNVWNSPITGPVRSSFRISTGLENIGSARVDRTEYAQRGFVFSEHYALPVISRTGVAYRVAVHKGWLNDSLPSLAFTTHVQFDDDLTQRYNSAWRFGGELEVCGILALRAGWYSGSVNDYGHPEANKSDVSAFTYGFGANVPLAIISGNKWPVTVSLDYTSLPQVSFGTDDLDPFTDKHWERFQSRGLRLGYGLGPLLKKKPNG